VPLLIITARDNLDDRLRGLDGGADACSNLSRWPNCWRACVPCCAARWQRPSRLGNGVVALDLISRSQHGRK
jgi:two-component system OmpR family response regulator